MLICSNTQQQLPSLFNLDLTLVHLHTNITKLLDSIMWDDVSHEHNYPWILGFRVNEEVNTQTEKFLTNICKSSKLFYCNLSFFGKRTSCSCLVMLCTIFTTPQCKHSPPPPQLLVIVMQVPVT